MIRFGFLANPLMYEVYRLLWERGAAEVVLQPEMGEDDLLEIFLKHTTEEQRQRLPKIYEFAIHNVDCYIILNAPRNTRFLSGVAASRFTDYGITLRPITRHRVSHTRWVVTQFPTQALAQDADMSLGDYEDFLFSAINDVDWNDVAKQQAALSELVNATKSVRIIAPDTDLTFSIEGRHCKSAAGETNMPDGEVYTSVVENSTLGKIHFNYPAVHAGQEFNDIHLEFQDGKAVKAMASKGEIELNKILDMDAGARTIGEFGIGNNFAIKRYTKNTLFDEKIGGTLHLALGQGYEDTLSQNSSGLHWDLVKDLRSDGELWFDKTLVQKNGAWQVSF